MINPIDLHTHSSASDGGLSPSELVRHAEACGIQRLALTDHDTIAGIAEARAAAQTLELIPGIEISVTWNSQVIHVVGLNIDPDDSDLLHGLQRLHQEREKRAHQIAHLLAQNGLPDPYEGAKRFAKGAFLGRAHFAYYLVEQGWARDIHKVFKHYLVRGKPGYVAGRWAELGEAVAWIKNAGGIAVIAHPARYKITRTKLKKLLHEFKAVGGIGLEVVSGSHQRGDNEVMARLADEFGFYSSAGSDYHSPRDFWFELGTLPALPPTCQAIWTLF
jgi:3',5'-nucleoside bisphosphate phosphatase